LGCFVRRLFTGGLRAPRRFISIPHRERNLS
jgi:hypothetical protein